MTFRDLCPALANKTYFNYGGQGPLPDTLAGGDDRQLAAHPGARPLHYRCVALHQPGSEQHPDGTGHPVRGCPHRLALSENVTSGCVVPLWGLPLKAGDRLLISDCEHPGVVAACQELARRQKLEIDTLPVKQIRGGHSQQATSDAAVLSALEQHLQPNTRLVVLSHLLWNTGQLCRSQPSPLSCNAIPATPICRGCRPDHGPDPRSRELPPADIYAFTGHKWACGPEGLGASPFRSAC